VYERLFGVTQVGVLGLTIARLSTIFSSQDTMTSSKPIYLIEGNIGVGKSTLCDQFKTMPASVVVCESVGNRFVQAFNNNRGRFAFALQMTQLTKRQYALQLALARSDNTTTLIDRSLVGDFAFALWNAASANLAPDEWALYCEQAGNKPQLPKSSRRIIVVFLHDDVESCAFRQRRRDQYEIDTDYLAGVEAAHLVCLACLDPSITVVELYWREYARDHANTDFLNDAVRDTTTVLQRRETFKDRARQAVLALSNTRAQQYLLDYLDDYIDSS